MIHIQRTVDVVHTSVNAPLVFCDSGAACLGASRFGKLLRSFKGLSVYSIQRKVEHSTMSNQSCSMSYMAR
jgi:hypothetical protein